MTDANGEPSGPTSGIRNPFVGPRPFEDTPQDRARFFGRDLETAEVTSLILTQQTLLLYAASGAGKSSLMKAAVLPILRERGVEVLPVARFQTARKYASGSEGNPYVRAVIESLGLDLAPDAHLNQAMALKRSAAGYSTGLSLLVFDQFEELFTIITDDTTAHRREFFTQIRAILEDDPLLRLVFVVREDFLARVDPYAALLQGGIRARFRLRRLSPAAATDAIIKPLRSVGKECEPGAADSLVVGLAETKSLDADGIVRDVPGEFVEAVQLQVVCRDLWDGLPHDAQVLTKEHFARAGNVDRALTNHYERAITKAAQAADMPEAKIRRWVDNSLITSLGTRNPILDEDADEMADVIASLEANRLLRPELRSGARWFELTHDRLIGPIQESNLAAREAAKDRFLKRLLIAGGVAAVLLTAVGIWIGFLADSDTAVAVPTPVPGPEGTVEIGGGPEDPLPDSMMDIDGVQAVTGFVDQPFRVDVAVTAQRATNATLEVGFSDDEFEFLTSDGLACTQLPADGSFVVVQCALPAEFDDEVHLDLQPLGLLQAAPVQATVFSAATEDDPTSDDIVLAQDLLTADVVVDTRPLLEGVEAVEFVEAAPGGVEARGLQQWFPVVAVQTNEVDCLFVMAQEFGDGRVVAIGHDALLSSEIEHADNARLVSNILRWVGKDNARVAFAANGFAWTTSATSPGLEAEIATLGYSSEDVEDLRDLSGIDVLVIGNSWEYLSSAEYVEIGTFVENGGGLVLAGLGWSWEAFVFPNPATGNSLDPNWADIPVGVPLYTMDVIGLSFDVVWSREILDPATLYPVAPSIVLPTADQLKCLGL